MAATRPAGPSGWSRRLRSPGPVNAAPPWPAPLATPAPWRTMGLMAALTVLALLVIARFVKDLQDAGVGPRRRSP